MMQPEDDDEARALAVLTRATLNGEREGRHDADRPLGTAHFATVKCQLIQQFATIQVTKFASPSVR